MSDHAGSSAFVTQLDGEPVELKVSADMVKRGLVVAPVLVAIAAAIWGADGARGALVAIALVLVNFALSAALIAYTARISLALMMGATLFGYLVRLGLIATAALATAAGFAVLAVTREAM